MLYILLYINAAAMMAHFLSKGLLQAASSHNQLSLLQTLKKKNIVIRLNTLGTAQERFKEVK